MLREELESFNIFALREYARRTGVSSPTSKKKDVLIAEIMDILDGKRAPSMTSKFGRPPKTFKADVFGVRSDYSGRVRFNQDTQAFDYSVFKDGVATGYLEQSNNNFILNILAKGKVLTHFVPYEISNKYDFRPGDKLSVTLVQKGANVVIDELLSINDVSPDEFNNLRPQFEDLKHNEANSTLLNYNVELSIKAGDIVYLRGQSNINNSIRLIDIMNHSSKTKNVYINISLLDKTSSLPDRLTCADRFVANLTDDSEYIDRVVSLASEHIKRLVESGYDVLVGVDDMVSIDRLNTEAKMSRQLLSIAKNTSDGGSISLVAIMPCDDSLSMYDKLCDKAFWIE